MYNPWSMVNFLCSATLCDYWYGQASLAFILPRLQEIQKTIDTLFEKKAIEFTAGNIGQLHAQNQMTFKAEDFLFYQGYLTLQKKEGRLVLGAPNREVERAFLRNLLAHRLNISDNEFSRLVGELLQGFEKLNLYQVAAAIMQYISYQPSEIHEHSEAYYHSHLGSFLAAGYSFKGVESNPLGATGRIDLRLLSNQLQIGIEIKFLKGPRATDAQIKSALKKAQKQIQEKRYLDSFDPNRPHLALGIVFAQEVHNLVGIIVASTSEKTAPEYDQPTVFRSAEEARALADKSVGIPRAPYIYFPERIYTPPPVKPETSNDESEHPERAFEQASKGQEITDLYRLIDRLQTGWEKERTDHLATLEKERSDHLVERTDLLAALDKERTERADLLAALDKERSDLLAALDKERTDHLVALDTALNKQQLHHKEEIAALRLAFKEELATQKQLWNAEFSNQMRNFKQETERKRERTIAIRKLEKRDGTISPEEICDILQMTPVEWTELTGERT